MRSTKLSEVHYPQADNPHYAIKLASKDVKSWSVPERKNLEKIRRDFYNTEQDYGETSRLFFHLTGSKMRWEVREMAIGFKVIRRE